MAQLKDKIEAVGKVLNDDKRPLKERFRALFTLKNIGGPSSIKAISDCFQDSSALLKHELAYCLGQMQDPEALPILYEILSNLEEHPMVRHEAGEAIGAIGSESSLPILRKFIDDPAPEVAETCQLAAQRIEWYSKNNDRTKSVYNTVDPTPSFNLSDLKSLKEILLNDEIDLFDRYKAMFALRDINTPESILALCEGLFVGGALFRHEVAFVLGQLQNEISIPHLIKALEDSSQNEMVRHECAEALGSIASDQCFDILRQFLNDDSRVVRESCDVALDMADYEMSNEFQYANTALLVQSV
ncbi:deoxyhypusine hydroxylase [Halyomorpha halys]|uniref:deoxyhypusine hydroxylase n=1 Tax=Halyomorpha halys TaxID=286706 RepID=UPI0006D4D165|nr:deoxyhypusine hydroxylase [Halyomorpha halys]